jgi:hypothetical protein
VDWCRESGGDRETITYPETEEDAEDDEELIETCQTSSYSPRSIFRDIERVRKTCVSGSYASKEASN